MTNQIVSVTGNEFHVQDDSGKLVKYHEVIVLTAKPAWRLNQLKGVDKDFVVEDLRFSVRDDQLEALARQILDLRTNNTEGNNAQNP